jgi:hypothetical protein
MGRRVLQVGGWVGVRVGGGQAGTVQAAQCAKGGGPAGRRADAVQLAQGGRAPGWGLALLPHASGLPRALGQGSAAAATPPPLRSACRPPWHSPPPPLHPPSHLLVVPCLEALHVAGGRPPDVPQVPAPVGQAGAGMGHRVKHGAGGGRVQPGGGEERATKERWGAGRCVSGRKGQHLMPPSHTHTRPPKPPPHKQAVPSHLRSRSSAAEAALTSRSFTIRPPIEWATKTTGRRPTPAAASLSASWATMSWKGSDSPCVQGRWGGGVAGKPGRGNQGRRGMGEGKGLAAQQQPERKPSQESLPTGNTRDGAPPASRAPPPPVPAMPPAHPALLAPPNRWRGRHTQSR